MTDPATFFDAFAAEWCPRIDETLDRCLPRPSGQGERLALAMRYSVTAGGKRLRPLLAIAAGHAAGERPPAQALLLAGAAVEMIHTYSLIHDDLPAMDDDRLRRGRPTCHIEFDEATAILAGDALNTLAFETLAAIRGVPAERALAAVAELARGAGSAGMVIGQQADMELEGQPYTAEALRFVHTHKTAMLLRAAVRLGGVLAGAPEDGLEALGRFGLLLGLAFQVVDDVLDVESDTKTLGKTAGKDAAAGKATYPALIGLEASKELARSLHREAADALRPFGERATALAAILHRVVHRRA